MSTNAVRGKEATSEVKAAPVDLKFEIVVIPVSDVDRAKEFYARLGWRLDADYDSGKGFRVIQLTPPGSGCSINFGKNVTPAAPGSTQGMYLIVSDIEAARKELLGRGVEVSEVFHGAGRRRTPARMSPTCLGVSGSSVRIPNTAAIVPSPRSPIPTVTAGCYKRLRHAFPGASTLPRLPSAPQQIWRARCGVQRRLTASTKSVSAQPIRTGPIGMHRTWWRNRLGRNCRSGAIPMSSAAARREATDSASPSPADVR